MKTKRNKIIISTASVAAALQAVAGANHDARSLTTVPESAFSSEIAAIMAGSQTQAVVRSSTLPILNGIRVSARLLESDYSEIAQATTAATDTSADTEATTKKKKKKKKEKIVIDASLIDGMWRDGDGTFTESKETLLSEMGLTVPEGETVDDYFARVEAAIDKLADTVTEEPGTDARTVGVGTAAGNLKDSTIAKDYLSCYSNCHSACHGSRGWR